MKKTSILLLAAGVVACIGSQALARTTEREFTTDGVRYKEVVSTTETDAVRNGKRGKLIRTDKTIYVNARDRLEQLGSDVSKTTWNALATAVERGKVPLQTVESELAELRGLVADTATESVDLEAMARELGPSFAIAKTLPDRPTPCRTGLVRQALRLQRLALLLERGRYDLGRSDGELFAGLEGHDSLSVLLSHYRTHMLQRNGRGALALSRLGPRSARAIAADLLQLAVRVGSPVVLDLDHDATIRLSGRSNLKTSGTFTRAGSVLFDLLGSGRLSRIEWVKGRDGFLVDDRAGLVTKAARGHGTITGAALFTETPTEAHGFDVLASKGPSPLGGKALSGLKVWLDANGDARVQPSELKTLAAFGITSIGTDYRIERNAHGELLLRSHYVQRGKRHLSEAVWLLQGPGS